jgi:hypothetical protein
MRLDELCPRDRAACLRAESHDRSSDFDTQKFERDVRLISRLHGPTPLAADNQDPSTYIWAACFGTENLPTADEREMRRRKLHWQQQVRRDRIIVDAMTARQTAWETEAKARYENAVSRAKYFETAHPLR